MVDLLIHTLEGLGYPVFRQGSLAEDYPDDFFTFWNSETEGESYYDNAAKATVWDLTVYFYSIDPALVESALITARDALRSVGFVASGKGFDVVSDEITHVGRAIDIFYYEREV
jgi:hypothetical protein